MTTAFIRINPYILHQMLRMPDNVSILGIRTDLKGGWILELSGALPASGELVADYTFEHMTNVKFKGFRKD